MAESRAVDLLRLVHDRPGVTRAQAAAELGIGSGAAVELVARLRAAGWLDERSAAPTGRRGRPSAELVPHPAGPLVAAAAISHDAWQVALAALGGRIVWSDTAGHDRAQDVTLAAVTAALRRARRHAGSGRVRAVAVSVPGVVRGGVLLGATNLGWSGVDLTTVWPGRGVPVLTGNDATFAGWAEARRGAATGAATSLHLRIDTGIGGALVVGSDPGPRLDDVGGEFGHMPFGDPALRCRCGAHGCWDLMVDGRALARLLHRRAPADPARYLRRTAGRPEARAAVADLARALGGGTAGLVNALDPAVVTLGGSALDLLAAAPDTLADSYRAGLMAFRRDDPPPLLAAALGSDGPLVGALEAAFGAVLGRVSVADGQRRG